MHHDLVRILRIVACVAFAPVVTDSIREDITTAVERSGGDSPTNCGVTLKSVFGNSVPEVESTVRAGCTEGAVLWVEGDCVDGVNIGYIVLGRISVAFE